MTNDLIAHNPLLKKPLLAVLALAERQSDSDRRALEQNALALWDDAHRQSPAACVDILVRNGALTERILVDGEPYEGALDDLQLDENVPDDAVAVALIAITETGRALLDAYAPEHTLQALLAGKPHYRDIFLAALDACDVEAGASRADLERVINRQPALQPDPETNRTRIYPQYFIDALETAGGIAWDSAWRTTDAGKAVVVA